MTSWKFIFLLLVLFIVLPWGRGEARTYSAITVDVPHSFRVGERTFHPGKYEFIFIGPGLLAVREAKSRHAMSVITRSIPTNVPMTSTRLVFQKRDGHLQLTSIWMEGSADGMEIIGEEVAMQSNHTQPVSSWELMGLLPGAGKFPVRPH